MTTPNETPVPSTTDIYTSSLKRQRDHLEIAVATLQQKVAALEKEKADLAEKLEAATAEIIPPKPKKKEHLNG